MNPIIEKIEKLLRLANSSEPREAELAMQKAYELARANHVDLAQCRTERIYQSRHAVIGSRQSVERKLAGQLVAPCSAVPCPWDMLCPL
jgi:hypothetical protein